MVPVSFLYALCGVMRLVKFNIINVASSEKGDFSGMPIPNAAAMVVSYLMICNILDEKFSLHIFDIKIFIAISVISASLMVSTIPFKTPDKTFSFIPKISFTYYFRAFSNYVLDIRLQCIHYFLYLCFTKYTYIFL